MSLDTYTCLHALRETGGFSQAAVKLGISQPYLSQFVARLEARAGMTLVNRWVRPLELTPAGEIVLEAERTVAEVRADCERRLHDIATGVRGRVTIGASYYRERFFLSQVLPVFRARFPEVELAFEEGTTRQLETFVREGRTDFSLVIEPLYCPELRSIPVYREKMLFATCGEDQAEEGQNGEALSPCDFSCFDGQPFIIMKEGQKLRELFLSLCEQTGVKPKVILESESPETALSLASVGLGATITTQTLARRSAVPGKLRCFNPVPAVPDRVVSAAHRPDRYLSKAARALIEVMREVGETEFADG